MTKNTGRPSDFTQDIADTICERMADGKSMRKVCEEDDDLPSARTVLRWLAKDGHEEFRRQYAHAHEERADFHFDEAMEIADEVGTDRDDIAKARLRVGTRKWACARMNPKKYGDHLKIDATMRPKSHEEMLDELDGPVIEQFPALPAPGLNGSHEQALDGLDSAE